MSEEVSPGPDENSWVSITPDDDVYGVTVEYFGGGEWQVWVVPAEFVRAEPLESELQDGITEALDAVEDVDTVVNEDREIWLVQGKTTGPNLVKAAASVVTRLKDQIDQELADSN